MPSNHFLIPEYLQISEMAVSGLTIGGEISRRSLYVFVVYNEGIEGVFHHISFNGIFTSLNDIFRFLIGTSTLTSTLTSTGSSRID